MRKNACVVAVGFVAMVTNGAGIYPNPHLVARHVGADTNETVSAAVNDGTLWKNGSGTTTFSAPSFSSLSEVKVQGGGVVLAMDDVPALPTLPAALTNSIALWLDSTVNVVTSEDGAFVEKWYDCREPDVTASTLLRPYVESGNRRNALADSVYAVERRPDFLASVAELANRPAVYFGTFGEAGARWMHVMNTGETQWQIVRAREVFAVCARDDSGGNGHILMLGVGTTSAGSPSWTAARDYVWGDTQNVRSHFSSFRFDRSPQAASHFPVLDTGWHLISATIPMENVQCAVNQIGLDRIYPSGSGGFKLAELIMFQKRLSMFDRMRVEDYLWKKWMGAKQTEFGTLDIASNAVAEVRSSYDVRGALAGPGRFVQNGTGLSTVTADGFSGEIELKQGAVRTGNGRFVLTEGGQTLSAGKSGVVTRSGGGSAAVVEKTGSGSMSIGAISNAISTLRVSAGEVRLAPEADSGVPLPAMPDFPNADFEDFNIGRGSYQNVGGTTDTGVAYTNKNWIFSRVGRSGQNIVLVMNQYSTLFYAAASYTDLTDATGIGWNGSTLAYICRGSMTGTFTLSDPGTYRLQMTVAVRPTFANKPMRILVDGVECCTYLTSFVTYENTRFEVALPWLAAGKHEVTITDIDPADAKVLLFDDLKILPERCLAEAPVKVEIANPGFELPAGRLTNLKPSLAALEGWTVPAESADSFTSGQNARRWNSEIAISEAYYQAGLFCTPEEMPEGFLCAQLLGTNTFSQSVTFPSAGRYRLSFSLADRPMTAVQTVVVSVGGKVVKMVVVPHTDFRRYEAEFDVEEAGPQTLAFKGLVNRDWYRDVRGSTTTLNVYMDAAAYLDDIACERIGDIPAANLLADGGFEGTGAEWILRGQVRHAMNDGYGLGVWEYNPANNIGRNNDWPFSHTRAPISGTNAVVMGGSTVGNGALRQVVELEAGRYELSFSRETAIMNKDGTDLETTFWVAVSPGYEYNYNYIYREYPQETEMAARKTVYFTVPTNGEYMIEFHTVFERNLSVMLDDVYLRRADAAPVAGYADSIPEKLQVEVASGARLNLDFDGQARVKQVKYAGRSYAGVISHATHPEFVMGRGELYAAPRGTIILFR